MEYFGKKLEHCSKEELIRMIQLLVNDGVDHKAELSREKKLLNPVKNAQKARAS